MKRCKNCGEEKELSEYPFHDKKKGTYRAQCQECYNELRKEGRLKDHNKSKEQARNSYYKHSDKRKENVKNYLKNNPEKHKEWQEISNKRRKEEFDVFKSQFSCIKCGETHIGCLDFHHVDSSKKEFAISRTVRTPIKRQKELEKCIVLCANCHRKLHWEEKQLNNN